MRAMFIDPETGMIQSVDSGDGYLHSNVQEPIAIDQTYKVLVEEPIPIDFEAGTIVPPSTGVPQLEPVTVSSSIPPGTLTAPPTNWWPLVLIAGAVYLLSRK